MTRPIAFALLASLAAASAGAQERKWEVEVYGGGLVATSGGEGTRTLPAPGAPLVTSTPIFPSRETSSWFLGDGAALLNAVNEDFGTAGRITPLDGLLVSPGADRSGVFGARVRRRLNARLSTEFSVDMLSTTSSAPDGFADGVEASRQSFTSAFSSLLATGPFSGIAVEATAVSEDGSRRDLSATAAVNVHWGPWRSLSPYVTAGGGISAGSGTMASAQLTGRYRFVVLGEVPISETDNTSIRFERPAGFVLVLGGGVRTDLSAKWGLTIDGRVLVGQDRTRVLVDAQPAFTRATPAGFVESFTNPAIQFSNEPSTGRRSTLSGAALEGADVFKGGTRARTLITVGIARRF